MRNQMILCLIGLSSLAANANNYQCVGTEPSFEVQIQDQQMKFEGPDQNRIRTKLTGPFVAAGVKSDFVFVYKAEAQGIQISMVMGKCSDGATDLEYLYHMVYTQGSSVLYGCCNPIQ